MAAAITYLVLVSTFAGGHEVKAGTILGKHHLDEMGEEQTKHLLDQKFIRVATKADLEPTPVEATDLGHDLVAAAKSAGDLEPEEADEIDLDFDEKKKAKGKK